MLLRLAILCFVSFEPILLRFPSTRRRSSFSTFDPMQLLIDSKKLCLAPIRFHPNQTVSTEYAQYLCDSKAPLLVFLGGSEDLGKFDVLLDGWGGASGRW